MFIPLLAVYGCQYIFEKISYVIRNHGTFLDKTCTNILDGKQVFQDVWEPSERLKLEGCPGEETAAVA